MGPTPRIVLIAIFAASLSTLLPAQETTAPPTVEQLAAMERVRPRVEAIWREVRTPENPTVPRPLYFWEVTGKLIAIGPDVVPFLASEMELLDPATFHFCAYAIGHLGGPDAEAALRKAVRAADAREGNFGRACKRYALFGLALGGKPEALDLMFTGLSTRGTRMVPELPLVTHLAILIGPAARPTLEKHLEAYRLDPQLTEKLQEALLAITQVGDASLLPKLKPLLANPSPEVRAVTGDAISHLGEPADCQLLLAPLSSAVQAERRYAADSLERWKPEPCYKAMVDHLAAERDVAVRGSLYNAIATMRGEGSLDVFRTYLNWGDQFDRALVIGEISQIGSPKGLNQLRSLLTSEDSATVVRSMQAMGAIGGESAMDTLLAMTSDPRKAIAAAALEVLVDMGATRVAPRVASTLLDLVREPVGNLSLRPRIAAWGDALVKFSYTEPIDDLKARAAVQSDPEIKASLDSCVRRLQLIKGNGDDVTAWTSASASPFLDVRQLADRRLAQLGSRAAIRALTTRLQKSDLDPEERAGILLAIAEAQTQGAAELVELHLSDSAYDAGNYHHARSAAAWAARRLGGDRMIRALRLSAVRREGRDWETLVYLAVLEKGAALPTLKTLRVRRLRYPQTPFGHQEAELDGLISDLIAGRDPKAFDVPPGALHEH